MYALMTDDVYMDRAQDAAEDAHRGTPDLVLVEGEANADVRRARARRRKPPLPTLHLEPDEILPVPAA